MSALTLGSTMGILTWMFVDGHGSDLMNYTPQPLMAPMIGLIIAVIWGLSTDYEVFLVSRMVEARERGMSTAEAIRIGTATTGRLITGAALVLAVVAGAFVFSDLVMMKYLAFGLLIALLLDATIVRMFLVPAIMKLLGDDCWWAPRWMKRLQERLGLGETELPDERKRPAVRDPAKTNGRWSVRALRQPPRPRPPHDPTHPAAEGASRPGATTRIRDVPADECPVGRRHDPDTHERARRAGRRAADHAAVDGHERGPQRRQQRDRGRRNDYRPRLRRPRLPAATGPAAPREEREIESWLGELRGTDRRPPVSPRRRRWGPRLKAGDGRQRMRRTRCPSNTRPNRVRQPEPGNEPTTAIPDSAPTGSGSDREDQHPRGRREAEAPRRRSERPGSAAPRGPAVAAACRLRPASMSSASDFDGNGPSSASCAASSAAGSLASSTRTALLRNATAGTASSAPTMPASTPPAAMASTTPADGSTPHGPSPAAAAHGPRPAARR